MSRIAVIDGAEIEVHSCNFCPYVSHRFSPEHYPMVNRYFCQSPRKPVVGLVGERGSSGIQIIIPDECPLAKF